MKNSILAAIAVFTLSSAPAWSAPPPKPAPAAHNQDSQTINDAITTLESTKKKLESTSSAKTSQRTQNAINDIKKALVELRTGTNPKQH